jgi:phage terminase small subunit
MLERTTKLDISIDRVLEEAARLAFSDVRNLFDSSGFLLKVTDLDDDTAAAIQSIEVTTRALGHSVPGEGEQPEPIVELTSKIKLVEKRASVEMLMRHLGLFEKDNMQQEADIASVELIFRDGRETANG